MGMGFWVVFWMVFLAEAGAVDVLAMAVRSLPAVGVQPQA